MGRPTGQARLAGILSAISDLRAGAGNLTGVPCAYW
jgi:hypothetical protein